MFFVGIDWASRAHELCVVGEDGAVVERFGFGHSERGISGALTRLAKLAGAEELPVAIERPDGLLVDRLLDAGHEVVPIHANAFHAARPRWEGAGAKSDVGDAYRLADLLRTDRHRLRPLRPLDQATRELQALVRLRDDHVKARVAATNQLAALLAAHWPGAAAIFGRLDSEIALAFLERYPTPQSTARPGETRLAAFLRRHSYCGTESAEQAAALCGAVPVTKRSGQQRAVSFRHTTNAKARKALTVYADNSRHASPWAERIYRQARARGCRHAHAIRILARAWLRVIDACWHTQTTYDPARRRRHDPQLKPLPLTLGDSHEVEIPELELDAPRKR